MTAMTKGNWITLLGSGAVVAVAIVAVVVTVWIATLTISNQISRELGSLQSDVSHLQQSVDHLDSRFDDLEKQLGRHQHDPDGGAVFYVP